MRRGLARAALLLALVGPIAAAAADLAYVGESGALAAQAAEAFRSRAYAFDRSMALATIGDVVDAVKSGRVAGGVIPAMAIGGMPIETTNLLLGTLDPGVRIVGETRIADTSRGAATFWVIARDLKGLPDLHPDRLVVNVEAPVGSKAFSLVVAGLSKLGFTVTGVSSVPLTEKPDGSRYMLVLAADKPILVLRVTDAIARDSRVGGGRALLIGAWIQTP